MPDLISALLEDLQAWHLFGSFVKPLELKNSCSPVVNINSAPQSAHVNVLSDSATGGPPWKWLFCPDLDAVVYLGIRESFSMGSEDTFSIYTLVLIIATSRFRTLTSCKT